MSADADRENRNPDPREVLPEREVGPWQREVDVVVVGLGCAGACAALEASAAGAETLVLERASGGGGTSALSGGVLYLGGGTAVQREAGFEDSPEEMFKYLMASCGPAPDEAKIQAYSEGSVAHFEWIVSQGLEFKPVFYPHYSGEPPTDDGLVFSGSEAAWPFDEIARPAPRGHCPRVPGAAGGHLMQKLCAAVDASPASVVTDARARALVRGSDGSIVGLIAEIERERVSIRARRGVILTTGGFINDDKMLGLHAPELRRCSYRVGAEGDDGSGIRLGSAAGGATIHLGAGSVSLPIHPPKSASHGVLVNAQGQRFINEDCYMGRLGDNVLLQQDGHAFLLFDDPHFVRPGIPRDLLAVGETWAEVEGELGLPAGALQATMTLFNEHAHKGADPLFHKRAPYLVPLDTPPFAAIDCRVESSMFAAFTLGGLHTDAWSQVLTASGEPIPGLFAAGRSTSGIAAPGYSSGLSLGDGSFFGRRAGVRAASRTTD